MRECLHIKRSQNMEFALHLHGCGVQIFDTIYMANNG